MFTPPSAQRVPDGDERVWRAGLQRGRRQVHLGARGRHPPPGKPGVRHRRRVRGDTDNQQVSNPHTYLHTMIHGVPQRQEK